MTCTHNHRTKLYGKKHNKWSKTDLWICDVCEAVLAETAPKLKMVFKKNEM